MPVLRKWVAALALSACAGTGLYAADTEPAVPPTAPKVDLSQLTFGTLREMPADKAKDKLSSWLKAQDKLDQAQLDAIFAKDKSTMEKFVEAVGLGSSELKELILSARDITSDAPTEVPAAIKNEPDAFIKTNVAAAYARSLSARKVYEEALATATVADVDQLVDPSAYYFFKAVAEHSLAGYQKTKKLDAQQSVVRLLDDVMDAPDRYKMVATLMFFDIQGWSKDDKDLSNIGKLMDNSSRRLELARGGETTQNIQKKIVFRLDEKIKELENQMKPGSCNGGSCPSGGQPGAAKGQTPSNPADSSSLPITGPNDGKVDAKKLKEYAETWGKLPPEKRKQLEQELTKDVPPKYKVMIEDYFKSLNKVNGFEGK